LDKYDIPFLVRNIQDEMPWHNRTMMRIPRPYGSFPKNIKDEYVRCNGKFLDNRQAEMEETNTLFSRFSKLIPPQHILACGFLINPYVFAGAVNGPDLITNETGSGGATGWNGSIYTNILPTGNVTDLYNQSAIEVSSAVGNMRQAVYDGDGLANNLYQETASFAASTDYDFHSLTEFDLDTTENWVAFQVSSSSCGVVWDSSATLNYATDVHTYGAFLDSK